MEDTDRTDGKRLSQTLGSSSSSLNLSCISSTFLCVSSAAGGGILPLLSQADSSRKIRVVANVLEFGHCLEICGKPVPSATLRALAEQPQNRFPLFRHRPQGRRKRQIRKF